MPVASFSQTSSSRRHTSRLANGLALAVFLGCLAAGLILAGEKANKREAAARALARVTAQTRSAAIEAQFARPVAAAEALGAVARQNGGTIPNFQRLATDMFATWPGLDALELQPGGVTSDIVPRLGHERTIGFNAFKDPLYRFGAYEAMQNRTLTVSGPLPLLLGVPGIVARNPLFQRGRDGRDTFTGFVAVSMRIGEALARAKLDDLAAQGYDFALFAYAPSGGKPGILASRGVASVQADMSHSVWIRNLEFRLAVRPRGGWFDKSKIALDTLGVLAVSCLAGLTTWLFFGRLRASRLLIEMEQRLAGEADARTQAFENSRRELLTMAALQEELKLTKSSLERAEFSNSELQSSLSEEIRHGAATREEAKTKLNQARQNASELQARLEAGIRAADAEAQARNNELEESRSMLEQALQRISEMQALLEAASLVQNETTAKYKARIQQDEAAMKDLQARLDAALNAARESVATPPPEPGVVPTPPPAASANAPEPSTVEIVSAPAPATEETVPTPAPSADDAPAGLSEPEQAAPAAPESIEENIPPINEQSMKRHAPKAMKHKHAENQLDLFGLGAVSNNVEPAATVPPVAPESVTAENQPPPIVPLPSIAPLPDKPVPTPVEEPPRPEIHSGNGETAADEKPSSKAASRREDIAELFPELPATNAALLRKAVKQILPLLADQDPGAVDCFEDNRAVFRTAFTREGFVEFERLVKTGESATALADLKKAAKKHGVTF